MDKETFIQFVIISAVILIAWWAAQYFLLAEHRQQRAPQGAAQRQAAQPPPARPAEPPQPAEPAEGTQQPPEKDGPVGEPEQPPAPEPVEAEAVEVREATLANERLKTVWTNRGAALKKLTILDDKYKAPYYEGEKRPDLVLLKEFQQGLLSDTIESVTFLERRGPNQPLARYEVPTAGLVYRLVEETPTALTFEGTVRDGHGHELLIRKSVTIGEDRYHFDVELRFQNPTGSAFDFVCSLRGAAGIERETLDTNYLGTRVGIAEGPGDYEIADRDASDLKEEDTEPNESANIAWAAVVNHYFAAVTRPEKSDWIERVASRQVIEQALIEAAPPRWDTPTVRNLSRQERRNRAENATVVLQTAPLTVRAGETVARGYRFITPPKSEEVLASYGGGMEGLTEFGFLSALSKIAVSLLNAIHFVLPNYGLAILVLTGLVRLGLHPLTRKQQVSMIKMRKLQPQIQEIQRKHAEDKQKQTEETMALYQKYGVHPLSGCFPLLLQLPVFIALFRALRAAIELRHAGFLWIGDLSQPDTIFHLPFTLPILGNEFNLLPLLMVGVMLLQQRSMPQASTEQAQQQQKIMKWFPLFFVVLLYHFPSGLVLYWTTSSGIAAIERWIINRHSDEIELKPNREKSSGGGKRKDRRRGAPKEEKKGWFQKLQDMAEQQARESQQAKSDKKEGE